MRVLIIAERANPELTSIPLEGWSHSQAIRRRCDVHLVTQVRNRDAIISAGLKEGVEFTAIDSESWDGPISRLVRVFRGGANKGWTLVTAAAGVAYYNFERLVWQRFGQRILSREFAVVHRITPLSPTIPSLLAGKCARAGVPFVLGPLNGGVKWPREFADVRRKEREWLSYVRGMHKALPGYRSTRKHAAAILVGSRDTWEQMPARYRDKCFYIPENGVDPARFDVLRGVRQEPGPLRVIFVGRLVPYKGADMLIEAAVPLLRTGQVVIDIVGDGPQMPALRHLADRSGVTATVTFSGWVGHSLLHERLAQADVFGFPSIREFGGAVVLEAMAMGLAPLVVDYGGPAELVTKRTGYLVQLGSRASIVKGIQDALRRIIDDRSELIAKRRLARQRVLQNFTWDVKAGDMIRVYEWLMGKRDRPVFPMPIPDSDDENTILEPAAAASA